MAKNKSITHVEDFILENGREGGLYSISILEDVINGRSTVTTKWDGNPAIIFGTNPENGRFFVGTKAVFNKKNPRICYTENDIDQFYSEHPDLASCLKTCLKWLPELHPQFVYQGEFLFVKDQVETRTIGGKQFVTFQPNNIRYAFLAPQTTIEHAQVGVVLHTRYEGSTLQDLNANFDAQIETLRYTPNVWCRDASCKSFILPSYESYYLNRAQEMLMSITDKEFEELFHRKTFITLLKQYFNHLIRSGSPHQTVSLVSFISSKNERYVEYAHNCKPIIEKIIHFQKPLVTAKHLLIEQLEKNKGYQTFDSQMRKTSGEGYVVIDGETLTKLVNRPQFSHMNFKRFAEGSPIT